MTRHGAKRLGASTAAVALAAALLAAGPAAGQQGASGEPDAEAPAMAEAPRSFHLGPSVSVVSWEDDGGPAYDDVTLWGIDVERLVASFLAVRLDGGYGRGEVTGGGRTVELNSYLAELALAIRPTVPPLARAGVAPYVVAGLGTVVHDPANEDLSTASQNALSWGLGVEVEPLDRFGARLEWRRYEVDLENLLDPADRTGTSRAADRLQLSLYWTF